jgi:hypothetical protein
MINPEKDIAWQVLAGRGLSASKLGLRFDRVVVRVLGDLRAFAEGAAPEGVTVLVTITAPIRLPARTIDALWERIRAVLAGHAAPESGDVHGNQVRVRLVTHGSGGYPKLVGFVHNPGSDPDRLLDFAQRWLGSRA